MVMSNGPSSSRKTNRVMSYGRKTSTSIIISGMYTNQTHSHCNTCKLLSGSAWTLNQIIPKKALKITKGESKIKTYTYHGDSGKKDN